MPCDAFYRHVYMKLLGTAFSLDTGTVKSVGVDWCTRTFPKTKIVHLKWDGNITNKFIFISIKRTDQGNIIVGLSLRVFLTQLFS